MPNNEEGGSEPKDEHGCIIGKEVWNEEQEKCIPKPAADTKNPAAKMSMDQAFAEVERLTGEVGKRDQLIGELTTQLKEANDVLEAQDKSKLIHAIMVRSNFKMDALVDKSVENLKDILATLDQATLPTINNAAVGVLPLNLSDREKNLTVGDLSIVTAEKRKRALGGS